VVGQEQTLITTISSKGWSRKCVAAVLALVEPADFYQLTIRLSPLQLQYDNFDNALGDTNINADTPSDHTIRSTASIAANMKLSHISSQQNLG
jgi:hypothetical protein